jgi:Putative MetA-pathway of phenol degradation
VRVAALALVLLLLPVAAGAEDEPEPIEPDRAGAATSTNTVGRGAVQLETGVAYAVERAAGASVTRQFNVDLLVRVGVTERLEVGFFGDPVVVQWGSQDVTDHGDFTLGAKYRFLDAPEGSALPALGVLPFVKLPVSEPPLGSGKTDVGALLLATFALPWQLSLDLDAGLAAIGQTRPGGHLLQAIVIGGLSYDAADWLTLFTDTQYTSREERDGRDRVLLDAGVMWRPTRNVALDASVVTSLVGAGPDWALRAGVSVRVGR